MDILDLDLKESPPLTQFHKNLVERYLLHGNAARAYREIGGEIKDALEQSIHANRILKLPQVRDYLAERRKANAIKADYGALQAMDEAKQGMEFAIETRNANAFAKAVELRAKLQGLLIERQDIRHVGSFSISINGIDDEPSPNLPLPNLSMPNSSQPNLPINVPLLTSGKSIDEDEDEEENIFE
jgi:hypothetical protein